MLRSVQEFHDAIKAKDGTRFDRAFESFTSACNSCHEATGLEFIDIRVPRLSPIMTSPLSDQSFAPK
jgi:cytochrome c553